MAAGLRQAIQRSASDGKGFPLGDAGACSSCQLADDGAADVPSRPVVGAASADGGGRL